MNIRHYNPKTDYSGVLALYRDTSTFGGQYDDARDTEKRLADLIAQKPESILIAEENEKIVGTVTLFEDGRAAWLYRFAVLENNKEAEKILCDEALKIMKQWGHEEVLVYAPVNDDSFEKRYTQLGFNQGGNYTAYWKSI